MIRTVEVTKTRIYRETPSIRIAGAGKYLPDRIVTNEEVVEIFRRNGVTETPSGQPLTPEWIEKLVGIRERHWAAPSQNTSDLALLATKLALIHSGFCIEEMNVVAVGTSSPESFFPSTACNMLYQAQSETRPEAFDLLAACTSGIYALVSVERALRCEKDYHQGLAIGAEVLATRMTNFTDINSDLWGDGAGAVVLKKVQHDVQTEIGSSSGIICSILGSDPSLAPLTRSIGKGTRPDDSCGRPSIYFNGHEVQKFVLKIIPELIEETIAKANDTLFYEGNKEKISLDDISLFAVHQANGRIYESPAKKLGIPLEKFYINVDVYANTSSAAVLIVLCEAMEKGLVKKGDLVLLIGFGSGLTWGSVLLRL